MTSFASNSDNWLFVPTIQSPESTKDAANGAVKPVKLKEALSISGTPVFAS